MSNLPARIRSDVICTLPPFLARSQSTALLSACGNICNIVCAAVSLLNVVMASLPALLPLVAGGVGGDEKKR